MPELPEVESVRQSLIPKICNKKIVSLEIHTSSLLRNKKDFFVENLQGKKITDIERIGKLLIFVLSTKLFLLAHLKMTGKFIYQDKKEKIIGGHSLTQAKKLDPKHTHLTFTFQDASTLIFHDIRRFGYLEIVDAKKKEKIVSGFGIEPLQASFTLAAFESIFERRKICLKAVLLDQSAIAGIGNIYADEICFASHILPTRSVSTLSKQEIRKLFIASQNILKKALSQRGTTFNDYVDGTGKTGNYLAFLKVYKRTGQPCLNCHEAIQKIRVAGRGTHICTKCQT